MKTIIISLITALVLAAPSQAQRPQGPLKRPAQSAKEFVRKQFNEPREELKALRKEVDILKREVAMLKKMAMRMRSAGKKDEEGKERGRSRRPSTRGKKGREGKIDYRNFRTKTVKKPTKAEGKR